jgi:glycosyltransferase involved in cell wall biosynthesis
MRSDRKILFVTDGLGNGGAERQLALLVKHMPVEWDKQVFSLANGLYEDVLRDIGVNVRVCLRRQPRDIRPMIELSRIISSWRPSAIHCFGWMSLAAALPMGKILHIPVIGTIRTGSIRLDRGYLRGYIQPLVTKLATVVISNSKAGLAAWKIPPKKGRVIYNGFDPERLKNLEMVNNGRKLFTVIMAARMWSIKDFEALIKAARTLHKKDGEKSWLFIALGDGPSRERLIEDASDLIREGILLFPEPCMEVLPWVRQADAGVLMTTQGVEEGLSNSVMEYMAVGLPVICSDGGGNRELVVDCSTGFLIPPGDSNALVDKLIWLRDNPDKAIQMGKAGQSRIMDEFTAEAMTKKTVAVYEEFELRKTK